LSKTPRVHGIQFVDALIRGGFKVLRTKGNHCVLVHPDTRQTVVPVHSGETIGPGLLRSILLDCGMTIDDLRALL
jgi:predicted RNA binding protein YcfA (HicA-like mRNA interferase family)